MKRSQLTLPVATDESFDILDSTKLSRYASCPRKYFFSDVLGWTSEVPSQTLHFGVAAHAAMEVIMRNGCTPAAYADAIDVFDVGYRKHFPPETDVQFEHRNPQTLRQALAIYVCENAGEQWEVIDIEKIVQVPITDEELITCKIDCIACSKKDGLIYAIDHKFSKVQQWWWHDSWKLRTQSFAYIYALEMLYGPEEVGGFLVNGFFLQKSYKDGRPNVSFNRSLVTKSALQITAWLRRTERLIERINNDYKALRRCTKDDSVMSAFPINDTACVQYNKLCSFHQLCDAWQNPAAKEDVLPVGFKREHWNPLKDE